MMWFVRNLFFVIKYKLGFAREGVDVITPGLVDWVDADYVEVIYE